MSGNDVVCPELIDSHSSPFDPTGRVLSVIGRAENSTPYISFLITGFDHTTGTLTVSPTPYTSGHPELSIQVLDVVVIRNKADAENSASPTQITDTGYLNVDDGYGGMTPGVEVGNILRVIQGTGRGQLRKITANTATELTWDLPLVLDTTSVWIVETPAWDYNADSTTISNADSLRAVTMNVPTDNFINEPLLIGGFTVDVNGTESQDGDVPIREDWIYGAEGQQSAGLTLPVVGTLGIQAGAAPAFYLNPEFTAGSVKAYVKSAPTDTDLMLTIYAGGTAWLSLTIAAGTTSVVASATRCGRSWPVAGEYQYPLGDHGRGHHLPWLRSFSLHLLVTPTTPIKCACERHALFAVCVAFSSSQAKTPPPIRLMVPISSSSFGTTPDLVIAS